MPFAVLTHHKCASNWLIDYSRKVAELNKLSIRATHRSNEAFDDSPDITVVINADYGFACEQGWAGPHVIRNPLDLICSAYYSHKDTHLVDGWLQMQLQRQALRAMPKSDGMMMTMAFLERIDFDSRVIGPLFGLRCWDYADPSYATLRMEDAVANVDATIGASFRAYFGSNLTLPDASAFAFEVYSDGRRSGEVDETSHYRSGRAGTWRDELPEAAVRYVGAHMSDILNRFYPEAILDRAASAPSSWLETDPILR